MYIYISHCENGCCFLCYQTKKKVTKANSFNSHLGITNKNPVKNRQRIGFHFLIVAFGSGIVQFPKLRSSCGWSHDAS